MTIREAASTQPGAARVSLRILPLFIGSGCAALIYEIVWFQALQLVIGASAVSLAVLLGAFMGGMSAGSLLLPRLISPRRHPLKVFAAIEMAIAICGALLIVGMPLVGRLYTAADGGGFSSIALRALVSLVLLLPPAMLMGATLPAISRYVKTTPAGAARLGLFYAGNIVGAVIGCLLAGFYLLRRFDVATASLAAVVLNVAVAIAALLMATRTRYRREDDLSSEHSWPLPGHSRQPRAVYTAIALSGFTALGAEVVWTRLLSLLFGATTYTFSIILAVFLTGLGAGSTLGAVLVRRAANPRVLFGWVQLGLSLAIAYGAWMVTQALPHWAIDTSLPPLSALHQSTDLYRALLAMLPGTLLWGMSVPLAISAASRLQTDSGAIVGRVYAANTFGAVAGAVLTGLVLIPSTGTHGAQRALIIVSVVSAGVILLPVTRGFRAVGLVALAIGAAVTAMTTVARVPAGLVAWGRMLPWYGEPRALYVGEGVNASIAVTEQSSGWRSFHVSGKVEASTEPQDMRLQRLLGHLTALMHAQGPKRALVVGFGAGVTAGAVSIHPTVERVVICELEPLIPRVVSKYFGDVNNDVATDLKVSIVYDDARHYMLTARETFDVITSDPIHPWVKGAATLYTREYFEHVRNRLNPGGVVTQWVPLYEGTEDSVRSVIATFLEVFPDGTIWRNDDPDGRGYDAVLVGRLDETPIDVDVWQVRLDRPEYRKVRNSLAEVGFDTTVDLLATYLGRARDLRPWFAGAAINTDRNLRLQYLAGSAVNSNAGTEIRDSLLRYARFPEDLITGDAATLSLLKEMVGAHGVSVAETR
jgi:spermidine synthase